MDMDSPPGAPSAPSAEVSRVEYERPVASAAVDDAAVELLRQTRPWLVLVSMLAFVGSALMLVVAVFAIVAGWLMSGDKVQIVLGFVYIPFAAAYIYPAMKLRSFAGAIERLVSSRSALDLEEALGQQLTFWRFSGMASIALGLMYIAVFVIALGVGVASGFRRL